MKYLLLLILVSTQTLAIEPDKKKHATAGLVIGSLFTLASKNKVHGMVAGCLAGAGKEALDSMTHEADTKDFVWTCASSIVAAYGTEKLFIKQTNNGPVIGINWRF